PVLAALAAGTALAAAPPAPDAPVPAPAATTAPDPTPPAEPPPPRTRSERLRAEVTRLHAIIGDLRRELAEAELRAVDAQRELAELRAFIADHHELGRDYEAYRGVRAVAEQAEAERRRDERRAALEQRKADRAARIEAARAARASARAEADRLDRYDRLGFSPVGLDVFVSRNAYSYQTRGVTPSRIDWAPGFGHYLRLYHPTLDVDFSSMTISGSVLNAAEHVRHVGIAIAFFDEAGNQVGHEMIRVDNARPDVPYPYTSTIAMALDRPFTSSTIYVLYADPVE
ncbi:MAG: hypothetical protein ACYTG1_07090, partial [Planctomycetota bacterium]